MQEDIYNYYVDFGIRKEKIVFLYSLQKQKCKKDFFKFYRGYFKEKLIPAKIRNVLREWIDFEIYLSVK